MKGRCRADGAFGGQADVLPEVVVEIALGCWQRSGLRWLDQCQESRAEDAEGAMLRDGGFDAGGNRVRSGFVIGHMHFPAQIRDRAFRWDVPVESATREGPE